MPVRRPPLRAWLRGDRRRRRLLAVTVSNLLPAVGVVLLGWHVADLLALYWLELGVVAVVTLLRVPFAGPATDVNPAALVVGPLAAREASLRVPLLGRVWLAPALTLPFLLAVLAVGWAFTGGVLLAPFGADVIDGRLIGQVGLVALVVVGSTVTATLADSVDDGDRASDPRRAAAGVLGRLAAVFLAGLATVTLAAAVTEGPEATLGAVDPAVVGLPLLVVLLLVKLLTDLAGLYGDRLRAAVGLDRLRAAVGGDGRVDRGDGGGRGSGDGAGGEARGPENDEEGPTEPPASDARRVRPAPWSVVLGGLARAPASEGLWTLALLGTLPAALFAFAGVWSFAVGLLGVTAAVVATLACLDHWLRYGAVAYHVADGVTAHDARFDTTLWRVEPWDETGLRVERDRLDRLLGTETVVVERRETDRRLPHLPDAAPVVAVFDRDPERGE